MGPPTDPRPIVGRSKAVVWLLGVAVLVATHPAYAGSRSGRIELPNNNPTLPRLMYFGGSNGLAGYVVDLGHRVPDGTPYTLRWTGGTVIPEFGPQQLGFRAFFYSDLVGETWGGQICHPVRAYDGNGGEVGTIDCGDSDGDGDLELSDRARYGIVVMNAGFRGEFKLTWG